MRSRSSNTGSARVAPRAATRPPGSLEAKAGAGGRRPVRPAGQGRRREPKPAPTPVPREGRLVAGHDEDLLYGRHAVAEALRAGRRRFRRIFVAQNVDRTGIISEIIGAARVLGCPVLEAPRERMDDAAGVNHQGVIGLATQYPYIDLDELLATPGDRLYLVLDHLQDVQNLGTLLRTAEAMAVTGVVVPGRRSAGITPAVVNASAGAVEHLPIALVGNLSQALERMKEAGVWVAGLEAGPDAISLVDADLTGPLALVVGAEGAGLARLVRERCDWTVAIPMYGRVESLNAATAGSIVLAHARQKRGLDRPVPRQPADL